MKTESLAFCYPVNVYGKEKPKFLCFFFLSIVDLIVITPCLELRKFPVNLHGTKKEKEQIIKLIFICECSGIVYVVWKDYLKTHTFRTYDPCQPSYKLLSQLRFFFSG